MRGRSGKKRGGEQLEQVIDVCGMRQRDTLHSSPSTLELNIYRATRDILSILSRQPGTSKSTELSGYRSLLALFVNSSVLEAGSLHLATSVTPRRARRQDVFDTLPVESCHIVGDNVHHDPARPHLGCVIPLLAHCRRWTDRSEGSDIVSCPSELSGDWLLMLLGFPGRKEGFVAGVPRRKS